jgi:hypothetical protein
VGERTSQTGDAGSRAYRGEAEEFLHKKEVTAVIARLSKTV